MTRRPSERERELAAALAAELDADVAELRRLLDTFDAEVRDAAARDDAQRTLLAIGAFLEQFESLAQAAVLANSTWIAERASNFYSRDIQPVTAQDTRQQVALLITTTRSLIENNRDSALLMQSSTGAGLAVNFASLLTRGDLNSIYAASDFALSQSVERDWHEMGRGIFPRKVAVAVRDDATTDLCRNRMDGQERGWDELYVDPVSGASWMYPPFVGAGLNRSEAFHFCRSVSVALL